MKSPKPVSSDAYREMKQSLQKAIVHGNAIIKKYDRIAKNASKVNDIESMVRAHNVIALILQEATMIEFNSENAKLKKSLARCEMYGGSYPLEEYEGTKFSFVKDAHNAGEWILINKRTGEQFCTVDYKGE